MSSCFFRLLFLVMILLLPVSNKIGRTVIAVDASKKLENTKVLPVNEDASTTTRKIWTEVSSTRANHVRKHFKIPYSDGHIQCLSIGSLTNVTLIFTQGAKGGISSPSVANFVDGFSELENIIVFRGRLNVQLRTNMFKTVIEHYHCSVIGGRSMGSRVAIATANEVDNVNALILVSFPLKGTRGENRDQLLVDIDEGTDVLLVIGSNDALCDLGKLSTVMKRMKTKTWLVVVRNANHKMNVEPSIATRPVGKMVGKVVARWIEERDDKLQNCEIHWDHEKGEAVAGSWNDGL